MSFEHREKNLCYNHVLLPNQMSNVQHRVKLSLQLGGPYPWNWSVWGMASNRREVTKKTRHHLCWSCQKPHSVCNRRCVQDSRVCEAIKCQGCVPFGKGKNTAPLSVLLCKNPDHKFSHPDAQTLFKDVKKYLKVMSNTIDENAIVIVIISHVHNVPLESSKHPPLMVRFLGSILWLGLLRPLNLHPICLLEMMLVYFCRL